MKSGSNGKDYLAFRMAGNGRRKEPASQCPKGAEGTPRPLSWAVGLESFLPAQGGDVLKESILQLDEERSRFYV